MIGCTYTTQPRIIHQTYLLSILSLHVFSRLIRNGYLGQMASSTDTPTTFEMSLNQKWTQHAESENVFLTNSVATTHCLELILSRN